MGGPKCESTPNVVFTPRCGIEAATPTTGSSATAALSPRASSGLTKTGPLPVRPKLAGDATVPLS